MPRFDKLEFGSEEGRHLVGSESISAQEPQWMQRADQSRRRGLYEEALKFYSRALEDDRSLVAGWLGQVQMLIHLDEPEEAELWSRKALELFPGNGDLMAGRAQAFCRIGQLAQAHAFSDGALQQSGQSAYRWVVRGELMVAGKQSVNQHCFDKARQLDSDWLVSLEIALIYLYYDTPSPAFIHARRAVHSAPHQHYPWYIQGVCEMRLGFTRQAKESFAHCLELCPQHADTLQRLAELERSGWWLKRLWNRLTRR